VISSSQQSNTQQTQEKNIHAKGRIQTRNPSNQAASIHTLDHNGIEIGTLLITAIK
jgi:hypothetical protein